MKLDIEYKRRDIYILAGGGTSFFNSVFRVTARSNARSQRSMNSGHSKSVISDRNSFISARVSYEYRDPSHPDDKMPAPRVERIVEIAGSTREKRIERFSSVNLGQIENSWNRRLTSIWFLALFPSLCEKNREKNFESKTENNGTTFNECYISFSQFYELESNFVIKLWLQFWQKKDFSALNYFKEDILLLRV
ncbi:hypothetical protein PUN28_017641 [Cardiocondyla obscurior]|uniref:Uncharacterized protein n=1 Tax=Cardiocondyla obscurior TaxID=286306 RepID=A0AAW2EPB0_9HYME